MCPVCLAVLGRVRRRRIMGNAVQAAQALGVAAGETPGALAFMVAAELVAAGRIVTRCGPITHSGEFVRSEH